MAIGNALVLFNDGESVEQADFNGLQNALTLRAWEVPGFADMVAFDQFGSDYGAAFGSGGNGRDYGVFTKGGGLLPTSAGLVSTLHPGMLGIWSRVGYGVPNSDPLVARAVRWFYLATSWTHTHDATASGQYRCDLVSCASAEAASVPTARPFQDATTGVATSVTVNKETVLTLDLALSATVTKGVEAGSAGAATIPAIPSGRNLLYYVLVHDSTITTVYDCTIPAGPLISGTMFPVQGNYSSWANSFWIIESTGASEALLLPPPEIAGDPSVRVLGFDMVANLKNGDTVQMATYSRYPLGGGSYGPDLSSQFTVRGSVSRTSIDLRGKPASTGAGPMWANGSTSKQGGLPTMSLISVTAAGAGTTIYSVTWYAVRG